MEDQHTTRVRPAICAIQVPDEEHYANRGSELWYRIAKRILRKEVILPDDAIFFRQATSRRRDYDGKMRLLIEPKEKMANRGVKSPDRAESVFSALYVREFGGMTLEQLRGSYVPHNEFLYPSGSLISFGPDDDE